MKFPYKGEDITNPQVSSDMVDIKRSGANSLQLLIDTDGCKHHTRSREGGTEAIKVIPLSFGAIMFDDFFCAEITGSMCRSIQTEEKP